MDIVGIMHHGHHAFPFLLSCLPETTLHSCTAVQDLFGDVSRHTSWLPEIYRSKSALQWEREGWQVGKRQKEKKRAGCGDKRDFEQSRAGCGTKQIKEIGNERKKIHQISIFTTTSVKALITTGMLSENE